MDKRRIRILKEAGTIKGPVIYWMSRDQRITDNWALVYAQELALKTGMPLGVVFCLAPDFINAAIRQYDFMLNGLKEVETELPEKNINFYLLRGKPADNIPAFVKDFKAGVLITDFDPLRIKKVWKQEVADRINIPFHEVDAHNIVPCWIASPKQDYAAYTFRPKIKRLLPEFLTGIPRLKKHPYHMDTGFKKTDWPAIFSSLGADKTVLPVKGIKAGKKAASRRLSFFINKKLEQYDKDRNNPVLYGQSGLSPYLHFGQISSQTTALKIMKCNANGEAKRAFLEELIIRRELSDNFCFYNEDYDNFKGFPEWAKKTLQKHKNDKREYLYSAIEFERALTHDELWNAAQMEIVTKGKMHGYMRMYWAKKILEWSESPEKAMEIAIYLNDRYGLDGRDPNGYTGIAWSIGGVHDRAWNERKIFGKIRYMSYGGCKSKFDVEKYIEQMKKIPP